MSAVSPDNIMASTPSAVAVLNIVPKFPLSFMFSSKIILFFEEISFLENSICLAVAIISGGVWVVDIFFNTASFVRIFLEIGCIFRLFLLV